MAAADEQGSMAVAVMEPTYMSVMEPDQTMSCCNDDDSKCVVDSNVCQRHIAEQSCRLENKQLQLDNKTSEFERQHKTTEWWPLVEPLLCEYRTLLKAIFTHSSSVHSTLQDLLQQQLSSATGCGEPLCDVKVHCSSTADCQPSEAGSHVECNGNKPYCGTCSLSNHELTCCCFRQKTSDCCSSGDNCSVQGSEHVTDTVHSCKDNNNRKTNCAENCRNNEPIEMKQNGEDLCSSNNNEAEQKCLGAASHAAAEAAATDDDDDEDDEEESRLVVDEQRETAADTSMTAINTTTAAAAATCDDADTSDCGATKHRLQVLDAAETFASIIGREIAASFDLPNNSDSMSDDTTVGDGMTDGGLTPNSFTASLFKAKNGLKSPVHNGVKLELDSEFALDTAEVARRVRDILIANNVGQRQFARHVLGLSQGTVSELLAKPKPWDRLTEKGRDSYRRMNQWAGDQLSVLALKAALPRKASTPVSTTIPSKPASLQSTETEQRVAFILSEAQRAIKQEQSTTQQQQQQRQQIDSDHVNSSTQISATKVVPTPSEAQRRPPAKSRRDRRRAGTMSPGSAKRSGETSTDTATSLTSPARDLVARIYEEELRKLMIAAEQSGNVADMAMYHRELLRLSYTRAAVNNNNNTPVVFGGSATNNNNNNNNNGLPVIDNKENLTAKSGITTNYDDEPEDLSMVRTKPDSVAIRTESQMDDCQETELCQPDMESSQQQQDRPTSVESLSPLQRMQCIANSLPSSGVNSTMPSAGLPCRQPLPPITPEQITSCEDINTDDLVVKIREVLSQYSISQRLFGEAVLGLSQGSVSDLLARPKPWPLLTQKGREPFVRMKAFLDEPDAISRLVATQYRVPADKLLRTSSAADILRSGLSLDNSNSSSASDFPAQTLPAQSLPLQSLPLPLQSLPPTFYTSLPPTMSPRVHTASSVDVSCQLPEPSQSSIHSDSFSPSSSLSLTGCTSSVLATSSGLIPVGPTVFPFLPMASYFQSPPGIPTVGPVLMAVDFRSIYGQSTSSPVITAGLPPAVVKRESPTSVGNPTSGGETAVDEIDTLELTARVRDVLQTHGLGQKLFGEAVLELSQGSVSELLAKPKPWSLLSAKGREPFLRMRSWLVDPLGIDRLRTYQSQAGSATKRKLSVDSGSESVSSTPTPSQKKPRLFFTEDQKLSLRRAYAADPYPNQAAIEQLANDIGVGVKTVVNWFHNHRMRAKQLPLNGNGGGMDLSLPSSPGGGLLSRLSTTPVKMEDGQNVEAERSHDLSSSSLSDSAGISTARTISLPTSTGHHTSTTANKRKRARPHRLSEGTVLDRTEGVAPPVTHGVGHSLSQPAIDATVVSVGLPVVQPFQSVSGPTNCTTDAPVDLSVFHSDPPPGQPDLPMQSDPPTQSHPPKSHSPPPEEQCSSKLESPEVDDGKPDRDESEREKNIERLQRNLEQEPADDWEF